MIHLVAAVRQFQLTWWSYFGARLLRGEYMLRCTKSIYANCKTYFLLFKRALCEGNYNEPRNEIVLFLTGNYYVFGAPPLFLLQFYIWLPSKFHFKPYALLYRVSVSRNKFLAYTRQSVKQSLLCKMKLVCDAELYN